jgi:hypothetical protein
MASSWLSLARQDEAMDNLLASWDAAKPSEPMSSGLNSRGNPAGSQ